MVCGALLPDEGGRPWLSAMGKTQVKPSQVALQNRERWWWWRGGDAHGRISTPFKNAATSRHCDNNTTKRAPNLPTPRPPPKRSFIPHPRVPPSHQPPHRIPSLRLAFRSAVRAAILLVRATRAGGRIASLRAPQAPAAHSAAESWRVSARASQCRLSSPVALANAPGQHACALAVARVWQRQCESQTGVSVGFQELAQATQTILQKAPGQHPLPAHIYAAGGRARAAGGRGRGRAREKGCGCLVTCKKRAARRKE